ncbi:unnamed protein product, partial [Pylaiella littoralis]
MALFISAENQEDEDEANRLRHLGAMVVMVVCRIWRDEAELAPTIRGGEPVIDDLTDDEAWANYRFRKPDLKRLFQAFKFPGAYLRLRNRARYPSESAFLLLLRRMRYPGRWQDLQREFGREYTQLSRIFNEVVDWAYDN